MKVLKLRRASLAYALVAACLSLGAPLGLVVLRALRAGSASPSWLSMELASDLATYLYVLISTMVVFTCFGYLLGLQLDRLSVASITDPLTRLFNRRYFNERLETEVTRAGRHLTPISVLLFDLDGLKAVNDRGGHARGDQALRHVARSLEASLRGSDVSARWGGDEFALLAPDTPKDAALALAERIRSLVSEGGSTVSVGVATATSSSPSAARLLQSADAALYRAKQAGRNCVRLAKDEGQI